MDPRFRRILIIGGVVIAAYLAYRWYKNRQASNSQGEGSNLGSVGYLTSGGAGSESGLNYYAGSTTVNLTQPVTDGGSGASVGIIPGERILPKSGQIQPPVLGTGDMSIPANLQFSANPVGH